MTAGDGIWHEEMLIPGPEGAEFLQLWFSLPADRKRIPAAYYGAATVPETTDNGATIRVVAGSFKGTEGAFTGIAVQPTILDIELPEDVSVDVPVEAGAAAFVYVARGQVKVGNRIVNGPELIVLTDGDSVTLIGGTVGARLFFVAAKPLEEPILQYRSFVMNTVEDIQETLAKIQDGSFAKYD